MCKDDISSLSLLFTETMSTFTDTDKGSWDKFIKLCTKIDGISSRLSKSECVKDFVEDYDGDLKVFLNLQYDASERVIIW